MWRNDVKDFMEGKQNTFNIETLKLDLEVKDANDILTVELNRPDFIFGISFILVPKTYKHLEMKNIIHPITKEEIPILLENVCEPRLGIPAHNDEDYEYAMIYKLPIKQVILPVNASLDDNRPREAAAIRELTEESGFYNIKNIEEMPFKMANVFYAAHKDINRYSIVTAFYIKLENSDCLELPPTEKEQHDIKWAYKEELYEILKNGFTDQIWLLKQHLKEVKSYTGMGKMIHSYFLNNLENPIEASKKVIGYFR